MLPRPTTGLPKTSLTVKSTTGAPAIVTFVTVTSASSLAQASALAAMADSFVAALLPTFTVPPRIGAGRTGGAGRACRASGARGTGRTGVAIVTAAARQGQQHDKA